MFKQVLLCTVIISCLVVYAQNQSVSLEKDKEGRFVPRMMNYQGYLTDSLGVPIDSSLDMEFRIYPVESGGNNLWSETHTAVTIDRGVFHVLLGSSTSIPDSVFTGGTDRWLEIAVDAQVQTPRTRITSAGYAYMATYSDTAEYARNAGGDDWSVTDSVLHTNNYLGIARGGANNVLYGTSQQTHVNLGAVACTTGSSSADRWGCIVLGGYWNLARGINAVVVGGMRNRATAYYTFIGGGTDNIAGQWGSAICGGDSNYVGGYTGFIGGGQYNASYGDYSAIVGGYADTIAGAANYSYLFGINSNLTQDSTFMVDMPHIRFGDEGTGYEFPAVDGSADQILMTDGSGLLSWGDKDDNDWVRGTPDSVLFTADYLGLARGNAYNELLGGVHRHVNFGVSCTTGNGGSGSSDIAILSGWGCKADSSYGTIVNGMENKAKGQLCFIGSGQSNIASGQGAVIVGGTDNSAAGYHSFIGGGNNNIAGNSQNDTFVVVIGGGNNSVTDRYSVIGGGLGNSISNSNAIIGGGEDNTVLSYHASILGGDGNTASGPYGIVGGGRANYQLGEYASILGGFQNRTNATYATIGGGNYNNVEGQFSAVLGGYADTIVAGANYSYLFGINSNLTQDSTFMVDMPHIRFGDEGTGYEFPAVDGSADQILVSDGLGQLSWTDMEDGDWTISGDDMYANVTGNIGVGTTSPVQDLHIQKPDFAFAMCKSDTHWAGVTIDKGDASDNGYIVYKTGGADSWVLGTVGDEKMRVHYWPTHYDAVVIQSDGNVGIGTETPEANLTVTDTTNETHIHLARPDNTFASVLAFTTGGSYEWQWTNGSGTDNLYLSRGAGSSGDVYMCYGDPKIHVGTYTEDDHKLNVVGYTSGHAAVRGADQNGIYTYAEGFLGMYGASGMPYNPVNIGILGIKPNQGAQGVAVYGWNNDDNTSNYSMYSVCDGSGTNNYALYAKATNGGTNWAGYFDGDVNINGNLTVSGGLPEDNDWTRGTPDSVLFTTNLVGISRGGANNVFYGSYIYSHIDFGAVCTTGMTGSGQFVTISGGYGNKAMLDYGTIGGGNSNVVHGTYATIAGGYENNANLNSFVGGGQYNSAGPSATMHSITIGGGISDTVNGRYGSILGGYSNLAGDENIDTAITITGGWDNSATEKYAFIGGGRANTSSSGYSVLGGGFNNAITAAYCGVIVGGADNSVDGGYASVIGGRYNQADGAFSLAAGYHAVTNHDGCFVWGDYSSSSDFTTTNTDQFLIRAANGVGINTNNPLTALHVAGRSVIGSAFAPTVNNDDNVLNLIVGVSSNGAANGISFHELTTGYAMKLGYNGVGSGDANMIEFYDSNDDPILSIQNGGSVIGYGDDGSNNFYLSNLAGFGDNGYIAVGDSTGAIQASMYVNSSGQGIISGDVKSFHMNNPSQPGTEIWYACIEGPEAAAYVRGTAHLVGGNAVIELPQHFVDVANPNSITVQLTPLSAESRGLAVVEKDLDGIVVRELNSGSGSYDFDYMVVAVRKGYEDFQVIRASLESQPEISTSTSGSDY